MASGIHNYICSIGTRLHAAIGNCDADLIRSYRRALNSGIARAQEAATREADARGRRDLNAVDGMMQEVKESTTDMCCCWPSKLQELTEEARASREERAVHYATHVTNLAGKVFETLYKTKWSRRDCTEYQDKLDWRESLPQDQQ
jgi:hypothetical protein